MTCCNRMRRPCACNQLSTYDRGGRMQEWGDSPACLSDGEVLDALSALLREWQSRFGHLNRMAAPHLDRMV